MLGVYKTHVKEAVHVILLPLVNHLLRRNPLKYTIV